MALRAETSAEVISGLDRAAGGLQPFGAQPSGGTRTSSTPIVMNTA